MLNYILACIYFFIPAYIANAFPPLANTFNIMNGLNKPIDGGRKISGIPVLGSHKTWRGLILEIIICTFLVPVFFFINHYYNLGIYETIGFDYLPINPFFFGFLLSIGILLGDMGFAFIKRRLQIRPGTAFTPFDQTNYVIGSFIVLQPIMRLSFNFWLTLFLLTFFIHIVCNRIGYKLGLHKAKW
jgi:CDP-2,3-bis-(O-geranylgeranyl)-sn-glycerol synthase